MFECFLPSMHDRGVVIGRYRDIYRNLIAIYIALYISQYIYIQMRDMKIFVKILRHWISDQSISNIPIHLDAISRSQYIAISQSEYIAISRSRYIQCDICDRNIQIAISRQEFVRVQLFTFIFTSTYIKGFDGPSLSCKMHYCKVKQHWARIVLGWETAWEHRVLLGFFYEIL